MSKPACMTPEEYALWLAGNKLTHGWQHADSPCSDCAPLFHRDMWDGGMCDGRPGGEPPHTGGRPSTDPEHLRGLSLDELHELRAEWPYRGAPAEISMAVSRARWRAYRHGLRVTA